MPRYLVRVDLPPGADPTALNRVMARVGFERAAPGGADALPPGAFHFEVFRQLSEVVRLTRDALRRAAPAGRPAAAFTVARADDPGRVTRSV